MSRKVRRAVVGQNCAAYLSVEHCKVRSVARRGGETALERAPFGGVAVGLVHDDVELPEIGRPELEEGHPEVARAPHRPKGHDHVDHGSSTTIPRCDDELLSGGGLDGGASCGSTSRGSNPVSSTGWTVRRGQLRGVDVWNAVRHQRQEQKRRGKCSSPPPPPPRHGTRALLRGGAPSVGFGFLKKNKKRGQLDLGGWSLIFSCCQF